MHTPVESSPSEVVAKKIKRQLVLFVNLDGVNAVKKDLFVKFATERANCLKANYSAYNILLDENRNFQVVDLKNESMAEFIETPRGGNELKRQQIYDAKIRVMSEFKANLKRVEGTYDYILVVGEMSRSSLGNSISNIYQIHQLADYLKAIITNCASKHLHLRVQICFSNQISCPGTTTSFASALVPGNKFVHLSAPTGWSIIGRNGTAIDFNLVHDVHFDAWAPFLSHVIMNNLCLEKIIELFNTNELLQRKVEWVPLINLKRERSEITIESLNIKLLYPSQTSEDRVFARLEHQSKNTFLVIDSPIPRRSPAPSRTLSYSPFLFREASPIPRSASAFSVTPTFY